MRELTKAEKRAVTEFRAMLSPSELIIVRGALRTTWHEDDELGVPRERYPVLESVARMEPDYDK